jgi:MFS superfamily sulfate permease-like transporter
MKISRYTVHVHCTYMYIDVIHEMLQIQLLFLLLPLSPLLLMIMNQNWKTRGTKVCRCETHCFVPYYI